MKAIATVCLAFLTGCASNPSPQPPAIEPPLYSAYQRYRQEAKRENIRTRYAEYFSRDLIEAKDLENEEVLRQLLFKDHMARIDSHHEKMDGQKGCLTINGHDDKGMPLSFNIEYAPFEQRWVIRAIDILFVNDVREFNSEGRCPNEYIN